MSEGVFFQDLALLLGVGGLAAVVFSRFRIPKVLGYILAGILLSGHTWGGSLLVDEASIQTIGQLGIVFLMFSMGLDFSMSAVKKIAHVTFPAAIFDTLVMTALGFTFGRSVLGWGLVPSLFLGVAICDSATTLLAKMIGELGWSGRPFVRYVTGTSVCEDIVTIGLLAFVTGVAGGHGLDAVAVGKSLGGLMLFLVATIFFGFVLVPRFLSAVAKRGDDEALLLALLGCCFFVSFIAYRLDYSLALGAFLVGLLGAGTGVRDRLRRLTDPMRSMFSAVFFVSIGLLVNPAECWRNLPAILLVSTLIVVGKTFTNFLSAIATGLKLKAAVQFSLSLAQIGEFAFMVALLYVSLTGDVTKPLFQITVGASLLTTVMNPLLIRVSDPLGTWIERKCPSRIAKILDGYRGYLERYRASGPGPRRAAVRAALVELVLIALVEFAVSIALVLLDARDWSSLSGFFETNKRFIFCLAMNAFILCAFALVLSTAKRLARNLAEAITGGGSARWQLAVSGVVRVTVLTIVIAFSFAEAIMINISLAPRETWARGALAGFLASALLFGGRFFRRAARGATMRFTTSFAADAELRELSNEVTIKLDDGGVKEIVVPDASPAVGETVVTLAIRSRTGAAVVSARRGNAVTYNIGPDWVFRAGDIVTVLGSGSQIVALKKLFGIVVR